jgi:hypothetical protein
VSWEKGQSESPSWRLHSRHPPISPLIVIRQPILTFVIQCDEVHPVCTRCSKGDHECVYRDDFDVFLRNETSQTAEKAQKKWRSRATKKPDTEAEHDDSESKSTPESSTDHASSVRGSTGSPSDHHQLSAFYTMSLGPSLDELAHQRFLFDFVVHPAPQTFMDGFQSFIPAFLNTAAPNSCFVAALSAAAHANYWGRCKSTEAKEVGVEKYGKALVLLNQTLSKSKGTCSEETLAAVSLLGIYEVCLNFRFSEQTKGFSANIDAFIAFDRTLSHETRLLDRP